MNGVCESPEIDYRLGSPPQRKKEMAQMEALKP